MSISQKKIISKDNCGSWVPSPFASSDGMRRRTARESLQREPRPVCLEGKKGRQEGKLVITTVISRLGSALYPPMTLPWAFESVMSGPALSSGSYYKEMQNWVWPFIFFLSQRAVSIFSSWSYFFWSPVSKRHQPDQLRMSAPESCTLFIPFNRGVEIMTKIQRHFFTKRIHCKAA